MGGASIQSSASWPKKYLKNVLKVLKKYLKIVWAGRAYSPQPAGQPRGARRQVCEYFNRRRDTNRQKIINTNIPGTGAAKNNQHVKVAIDDRQNGYQTVANVLEYVKTGKDKKIR